MMMEMLVLAVMYQDTAMDKAFFVWNISALPPPQEFANFLKGWGISHITVKLQNGLLKHNQLDAEGKYTGNDKYLRDTWMRILWDNDIRIDGWGWPKPKPTLSPGAQGDLICERYEKLQIRDRYSKNYLGRLTGWHHDVEENSYVATYWKSSVYRNSSAETLMGKMKPLSGKIPISICSYRFISYHLQVPWKQLVNSEYCDTVTPQVYPITSHNFGEQLRRCYLEYNSDQIIDLKRRKFEPVGPAFSAGSWEPTTEDLRIFVETAEELDCERVWFWSMDYIWKHQRTDWLEAIMGTSTPTPPEPPEPPTVVLPDSVVSSIKLPNQLNMRNAVYGTIVGKLESNLSVHPIDYTYDKDGKLWYKLHPGTVGYERWIAAWLTNPS